MICITCPLFGGSWDVFFKSFVDRRNEFGRNKYNITAKINSIDIIAKLLPSSARWALGPESGTVKVFRNIDLISISIEDGWMTRYQNEAKNVLTIDAFAVRAVGLPLS